MQALIYFCAVYSVLYIFSLGKSIFWWLMKMRWQVYLLCVRIVRCLMSVQQILAFGRHQNVISIQNLTAFTQAHYLIRQAWVFLHFVFPLPIVTFYRSEFEPSHNIMNYLFWYDRTTKVVSFASLFWTLFFHSIRFGSQIQIDVAVMVSDNMSNQCKEFVICYTFNHF